MMDSIRAVRIRGLFRFFTLHKKLFFFRSEISNFQTFTSKNATSRRRQVEDLLFERGIDICNETVRFWWNRFGPMFAAEIRKRRVHHRSYSCWRWHLDEVFVRINGKTHYLWRGVDHEGEVLEVFATKRRVSLL